MPYACAYFDRHFSAAWFLPPPPRPRLHEVRVWQPVLMPDVMCWQPEGMERVWGDVL